MEIPKELQDLVLGEANLEEDGITAFRGGDHDRCIKLMNKIVDRQPNNWRARLYLAMAYYSTGDMYTGAKHFLYLRDNCPDSSIIDKSKTALKGMETHLKNLGS